MSDLSPPDVQLLLEGARDPFFLLNEDGVLVFANRAFERLTGIRFADASTLEQSARDLMEPPADLPAGHPRLVRRPWGEGKHRQWLSMTFVPVTGVDGVRAATLVHASAESRTQAMPEATDGVANERLERMWEEQRSRFGFEAVPARSEAMVRLLHQVRSASETGIHLALIGEAGVGKRTLARVIQSSSGIRRGELAILDCRALTPAAQREWLLGGRRVSTEAVASNTEVRGILERSAGGALLLAGVGHLPIDLQEWIVQEMHDAGRHGWRVMATEREPLERLVDDGRMIAPFYYLVTRFVISVPPLRERKLELGDHCQWILNRMASEEQDPHRSLEPEALEALRNYAWPGNLTELEAVLTSAARRTHRPLLAVRDFPKRLWSYEAPDSSPPSPPSFPSLDSVLESVERRMLELALREFKGNKSKAAESLGISRPRLHRRAEQLGLELRLEEISGEDVESSGE